MITLYLFDEPDQGDLFEWLHVLLQGLLRLQALQDGNHVATEMEGVKVHLQVAVQLLQLWREKLKNFVLELKEK